MASLMYSVEPSQRDGPTKSFEDIQRAQDIEDIIAQAEVHGELP